MNDELYDTYPATIRSDWADGSARSDSARADTPAKDGWKCRMARKTLLIIHRKHQTLHR